MNSLWDIRIFLGLVRKESPYIFFTLVPKHLNFIVYPSYLSYHDSAYE